jgi:hypothetical protein
MGANRVQNARALHEGAPVALAPSLTPFAALLQSIPSRLDRRQATTLSTGGGMACTAPALCKRVGAKGRACPPTQSGEGDRAERGGGGATRLMEAPEA